MEAGCRGTLAAQINQCVRGSGIPSGEGAGGSGFGLPGFWFARVLVCQGFGCQGFGLPGFRFARVSVCQGFGCQGLDFVACGSTGFSAPPGFLLATGGSRQGFVF